MFNPENYPVFRVTAEFTDKKGLKWTMGGLFIAAPSKEDAAKHVSDMIDAKQFGQSVSVSFRQCDDFESKLIKRRANSNESEIRKGVWQKVKNTFRRENNVVTLSK